jgi:hypothetical protein
MQTVASTLGVARSNLIERRDKVTQARGPYRKAEDAGLLLPIRAIIDERPTYGYRAFHLRTGMREMVCRLEKSGGSHTAFIARFGPSGQADGICDRNDGCC